MKSFLSNNQMIFEIEVLFEFKNYLNNFNTKKILTIIFYIEYVFNRLNF